MKKIVKLICVAMIGIMGMSLFAGCASKPEAGGGTADYKATMSLDELANLIQENIEFAMTMPAEDEDSLAYLADSAEIDTAVMNEFVFRNNMMVSADVLFLAEAKTAADVEKITAGFEKHKANIIQSFDRYLPEPYEIAQQGVVATKGNYVMLVISQDNAKAIELFEANIQ